jgi:GMP synthase-like glutamine amidotransferase
MHQDHVPDVPPGFHLLGSTTHCYNQGMVKFYPQPDGKSADDLINDLKNVQILGTQGHPEYTEPICTPTIKFLAEVTGTIDSRALADAERRRFWREDGVLVGRAFWGMLGNPRHLRKVR